jgi:hypothetical protein
MLVLCLSHSSSVILFFAGLLKLSALSDGRPREGIIICVEFRMAVEIKKVVNYEKQRDMNNEYNDGKAR